MTIVKFILVTLHPLIINLQKRDAVVPVATMHEIITVAPIAMLQKRFAGTPITTLQKRFAVTSFKP